MEIMNISYDKFKEFSERKTGFVSYNLAYTKVLNFYLYKEHLNQKRTYVIDDVIEVNGEDRVISTESLGIKEIYARFGIYFKSLSLEEGITVSMDNPNREYIIFIGKSPNELTSDFIEGFAARFSDEYLPADVTPSWFIDCNTHASYKTVREVLNTLRGVYTKIESLIYYEDLIRSDVRDQSITEDVNEVILAMEEYYREEEKLTKGKVHYEPIEVVDITEEVDKIRKRFDVSNDNTVELFIDTLDKVGEGVTPYKIYVYYGIHDSDYITAACYLTYYHHANCFIQSSFRDRFLNELMDLYYNPDYMLVEDRIKYLLNFPTYTVQVTDYTAGYIGTMGRKVTGKVQLCPLQIDESVPFSNGVIDPKNVKTVDNLDFSSIRIFPLLDHFKLSSDDLRECEIDENNLRRLFIDFENAIRLPRTKIIDVCNTFFLDFGGEVCIAYLEDCRLETQSHIVADIMTTGTQSNPKLNGATNKSISITEEQVCRCIPLEVFHCSSDAKRKITLANEYFYPVAVQQKLGLDPVRPLRVVRPYKCTAKTMLPLQYYSINNLAIAMNINHDKYFHDIGMYATACTAYRTGGRQKLLATLDRTTVRKKSNLFSAYGGFHEVVSTALTITENMLVRQHTEK